MTTSVYVKGGKIVVVDGKVSVSQHCCCCWTCDDMDACFPVSGGTIVPTWEVVTAGIVSGAGCAAGACNPLNATWLGGFGATDLCGVTGIQGLNVAACNGLGVGLFHQASVTIIASEEVTGTVSCVLIRFRLQNATGAGNYDWELSGSAASTAMVTLCSGGSVALPPVSKTSPCNINASTATLTIIP